MGKQVILLSGDRLDVVQACAEAVGIQNYHAQLQPNQI